MTAHPADQLDQNGLDAAVTRLARGAQRWATLPLSDRAALLTATHASIAAQAEAWVAAACSAKSLPVELEGEEWLTGPYAVLRSFLETARSLEALAAGVSPIAGLRTGTAPGGRTTVRVLPSTPAERLLFHGFTVDVWLRQGVPAEPGQPHGADPGGHPHIHRIPDSSGVALVLGAGNITAIGPQDVLTELVAHNRAAVLKLNPTFDGLLDVCRAALSPLIDAELLHVVTGGADMGAHLTHHPGIDHVHLTGSIVTHDAIVWGTGPEAAARRTANTPILTKSISSELGGVSPVIVVPGAWSAADLRFQAEHVVTQRLENSGHNCISSQVLILGSDWPQREAFLAEVRRVLASLPHRDPWYPGADQRLAAVPERYRQAAAYSGCFLVELPATEPADLFTTEAFAPVLAITTLPGTGAEFFRAAVDFANQRLAGSLGASIIVAPEGVRAMGRQFEEALAELRYGGIGINVWSAFLFELQSAAWGPFPGNRLTDAGSGIGVVHNSFLLADTERTVVRGPFRPFPRSLRHGEFALFPKPPWFLLSRTGRETSRLMSEYAARPTWQRLLAVLPKAFRA